MKKIGLIVDDDRINNYICERLLTDAFPDIQVISIEESEEALSFIIENLNNISFLLLDLNMPKMDGWEFLSTLKSKIIINFHVHILTSSINIDDQDKSQTFEEVKSYIVKPLSHDTIRSKIKPL